MAKGKKQKKVRKVRQLTDNDLLVRDLKLMGTWFGIAIVVSGALALGFRYFGF